MIKIITFNYKKNIIETVIFIKRKKREIKL